MNSVSKSTRHRKPRSDNGSAEKTRLATLSRHLRRRGWEPGEVAGWARHKVIGWHELLVRAGLRQKTLPLAAVALELLAKEKPTTVRAVMYRVVSAGWLPNTSDKSYDRIQRLLGNLRKKGVIPYDWLVDNIRVTEKPSSWSGLADFADTVRDAYRKDLWASLPVYVEVIVEKDTVAGVVGAVTDEFDVALSALRGYKSHSFAWSIAQRWNEIDKPIHALYIGDHDPSGYDLERDIIAALEEHCPTGFNWKRIAVVPADFDNFKVIPLEPKPGDTRSARFIETHGRRCAEVEAIPADALRNRLRQAIEAFIPADQWQRLQREESQELESWNHFMDRIGQLTSENG